MAASVSGKSHLQLSQSVENDSEDFSDMDLDLDEADTISFVSSGGQSPADIDSDSEYEYELLPVTYNPVSASNTSSQSKTCHDAQNNATLPPTLDTSENSSLTNNDRLAADADELPTTSQQNNRNLTHATHRGDNQAANNEEHVYNSQMFNYHMIQDLISEIELEAEKCEEQLCLVQQRVEQLRIRLARATKNDRQSLVHSLRIQLSTTEGVEAMYNEALSRKLQKLRRLEEYTL